MDYFLQRKYREDKTFKRYLDNNSNYLKFLNRDSKYYKVFMNNMKDLYKERTTDKINNTIDTINIVSSIIDTIK